MRLVFSLRIVFVLLATGFLVLPAAGCGAKKKGKKGSGLTIKQQLDKADTESSPDRKAAAYVKVGRSQLASSDKSGAKTSVGKAFKEVSGEGDANLFSPRLVDIAELFVAVGDKKQARKSLELATTLAADPGKIEDPIRRAKILATAGAVYGEKIKGLGDIKLAKEWLEKAAVEADAAEARFRAEALAAVAMGYTKAGLGKDAAGMVGKLEEAARALEEPRAKAEAFAAAVNVQAQTGNKDEAIALLVEASTAAKSVERSESRAYALLAVAVASSAVGDNKQALSLLKEADKAADKVADPETQKTVVEKVRSMMAEVEKKK